MILDADKILEYITTNEMGKKAQVGYDLTIKHITRIRGGKIGKDETKIEEYEEIDSNKIDGVWLLTSGNVYSLTFHQGIKLDNKHCAFIRHRSSVLRCGAIITSGVFDPSFQCDEIGATMFVSNLMKIEEGARLAQILIFENYHAESYKGQYQGGKDKK